MEGGSEEDVRKLRNSAMRLVASGCIKSLDVIPALKTEMSLLLSLPLSPYFIILYNVSPEEVKKTTTMHVV